MKISLKQIYMRMKL